MALTSTTTPRGAIPGSNINGWQAPPDPNSALASSNLFKVLFPQILNRANNMLGGSMSPPQPINPFAQQNVPNALGGTQQMGGQMPPAVPGTMGGQQKPGK